MHPERVSPSWSPPRQGKRKGVAQEEERAWIRFYRRVGNPDIAAEVMALLDADAEARREHLALYLLCRESMRAHKARSQRRKRIGHGVRVLASMLIVDPLRAIRRALAEAGALLAECLPQATQEPARAKLRQLRSDPEVVKAEAAFLARSAAPADSAAAEGTSRTA